MDRQWFLGKSSESSLLARLDLVVFFLNKCNLLKVKPVAEDLSFA